MTPKLTRREFLKACAVTSASAGAGLLPRTVFAAAAPSDFKVERGVRQLFLDDAGIERLEGVRRVVNPPTRHPRNPLLKPDTAWERGCQVYGTAYFDEAAGRFKLWYLTGPKDRGLKPLIVDGLERPPHTTLVAYAESKDGIAWTKPNLGLFSYDGDKRNNLVPVGRFNTEGISVLHEPRAPDPNRRWKAFFWDHGSGGWEVRNGGPYAKDGPHDGLWVAFSPDGIHWTNYEGNPVIKKYSDTNQVVLHDPRLKRYVAFGRFGFGRRLARTESEDFVHWTEPKLVLACDAADGPNTQIYGAGVDLYEGVYVGMIWIYREGGDAKIDTQLATSRDGIHWTRVGDRAMWLALGDEDSWEGGMVRSVERIIRRGDKLYIYYCGVHGPHGRPGFPPVQRQHPVQIGLVTQRRDGFVSLDAGEQPGTVTTKPFTLPAGHLHLNVEGPQGEVRVALLDLDAKTLGQSASITGNQLRAAVKWDVRPPRQPQGRLRFTLRQARLYAYWFE